MRVSSVVRAAVLAGVAALLGVRPADARGLPRWTVVLVLDGDAPAGLPDLEAEVVVRVASLLALREDPAVRIVAVVDRKGRTTATIPMRSASAPASACRPTRWTGAKTLVVHAGCAVEVADHGPTNLGDPATLDALLERVVRDHRASHYALVLKGHAVPAGSICLDAVPGGGADDLTVEELRGALDRFERLAGRKLDLLALDGCSLSTVETLAAVAGGADHLLASPDLLFAGSLPYAAMIDAMVRDADITAAGVAEAAVAAYPEDRRVNGPNQGCDREAMFGVLASIPSAGVLAIQQAFDWLGDAARADVRARPVARSELATACVRALAYPSEGFLDAVSLADQIAASTTDETVRGRARAAAAAVRSAGVTVRAGPDMADSCGLSVCAALCDEPSGYFGAHAWTGHGWTAFLADFVPCAPETATAPLQSTVRPVGGGIEVTTAGAERASIARRFARAELVARVVGPSEAQAGHAVFRRPFSVPVPDDANDPTSTVGFRDVWDRGRFVLRGIPGATNGQTEEIECPIETIQPLLPGSDGRRAMATTERLDVTLSTGWRGEANLRLFVTEASGPSGTEHSAQITCAYTATREPPRPNVRGRPRTVFGRVPIDVGTTLRTIRSYEVGAVAGATLGPAIRVDADRRAPCVVYAPFPPGLTLRVGHAVYRSTTGLRVESTAEVPGR